MAFIAVLSLCFLALTQAAAGHDSSGKKSENVDEVVGM